MKHRLLLWIGLFGIIFQSCKSPCDGYPDSELKWVPYSIGDKIKYTNKSDTIEFEIIDFFKTKESDGRGLYMDVWCDEQAYYETNLIDHNNNKYRIKLTRLLKIDEIEIEIEKYNSLVFSLRTPEELESYNSQQTEGLVVTFNSEITLNDILYKNVYFIEIQTSIIKGNIDKIYIAEEYGVIEFHNKTTDITWDLLIE